VTSRTRWRLGRSVRARLNSGSTLGSALKGCCSSWLGSACSSMASPKSAPCAFALPAEGRDWQLSLCVCLRVRALERTALERGVQGVPYFDIGGTTVAGAQPAEPVLQTVIETVGPLALRPAV
jgi:hypothetical protein